jgi:hypothetical protein
MKKLLSVTLIACIFAISSIGCGGDAPKKAAPTPEKKDGGRDVPKG